MTERTTQEQQPDYSAAYRYGRQEFARLGWGLFALMFIMQGLSSFLYVRIYGAYPALVESDWFVVGLNAFCIYAVGLPVFYLIVRSCKTFDIPQRQPIPFSLARFFMLLAIAYAMTYLGNLVSLLITHLISIAKGAPVENPLLGLIGEDTASYLPYFLYMVVIAPIMEEFTFRKIFLDRVRKYGDRFSIFASGFAFALFHGNLSQVVYAFVVGSMFAYVVLRTGKLRYSMLIHAIINSMGFAAIISQQLDDNIKLIVIGCIGLAALTTVILGVIFLVLYRRQAVLQENPQPLGQMPRFHAFFSSSGMMAYILLSCLLIWLVTAA